MVILDSNIWIRATAMEPDEIHPTTGSPSQHDFTSSPDVARPTLRPRECRALISQQLKRDNGILVPGQQVDEILGVIDTLKSRHQVNANNERMLACVSQYVVNAGAGNRVPILNKDIDEQHAVLSAALSIAHSTAEGSSGVGRHDALRFISKNERFLARTLPDPNKEGMLKGRNPFIWQDWLLCRAARKHGTIVVTADRDMPILGEAYRAVTGYMPCRYLEYVPDHRDIAEFKENLRSSDALAAAFHQHRRPPPPTPSVGVELTR